MKCEQCREMMIEYLLGHMEGHPLAEDLETHLAQCGECRKELEGRGRWWLRWRRRRGSPWRR